MHKFSLAPVELERGVFSLGARGAMRLELGLLQGLNGPRSSGVKIALWQSR